MRKSLTAGGLLLMTLLPALAQTNEPGTGDGMMGQNGEMMGQGGKGCGGMMEPRHDERHGRRHDDGPRGPQGHSNTYSTR